MPAWVPIGEGPLVVVMGGSQGALGLNQMVRRVLPWLLKEGCRVVHLTGKYTSELSTIQHHNFVEKIFSAEMSALLQNADLAISRAGASAMSELAICGTPAILVPYPQAIDLHQDANASFAAGLGAAVIVHQHHPDQKVLRETLERVLTKWLGRDPRAFDPLSEMQTGMRQLAEGIKDSEYRVIGILEKLIK